MHASLLASLLPAGVVVEETPLAGPIRPLYAAEERVVARAVHKRRVEFAAGRHCARLALARLGLPERPLLPLRNRAPQWPPGVVGSITHTGSAEFGWCAAAVAPRPPFASLGVDVEGAHPLPDSLWCSVLHVSERAVLARAPAELRGLAAKLAFSAKEAVYKCQHPLSGALLDFHDVCVELDWSRGRFVAVLQRDVPVFPAGSRLSGRFRVAFGLLATAVVLHEADLRPAARARVDQEEHAWTE